MKLPIGIAVAVIGCWLLVRRLRGYRQRTAGTLLEDALDLASGDAPILLAAVFLMLAGAALVYSHYAVP